MINNLSLIGRITRDPEVRTTQAGQLVCNFTLNVPKRLKMLGEPESDFIPIVALGADAQYVGDYLTKGRLVGIEGHIQSRKIVDAQAQTREILEVVAHSVSGLDRPRDDGNSQR